MKQQTVALAASFIAIAGPALGGMEKVSFPGAKSEGFAFAEQVSATLNTPESTIKPFPAVVILHGSSGIDGRGAYYADSLNGAGIATLEVFMFAPGQRPKGGHANNLTQAFGALKYLASRPDIDARRIGVLGFSAGGAISLRVASKSVNDSFRPSIGELRFAAHAPLYPVCWLHRKMASDPQDPGYGSYAALTGSPVLILAGGEDDFDGADGCQKFLETLPEAPRKQVQLQYYPKATHGWDALSRSWTTVYDPAGWQGKGGNVRIQPDAVTAKESRTRVTEFFLSAMPPGK